MRTTLKSWVAPTGLVLAAVAALTITAPEPGAGAAERAALMVEKVEFGGWKNNVKLSNGTVELIATLDVGPRIISYKLAGGKNVFKEFTQQFGKSGEADWVPRGGHRLWAAPEDLTRTYAPDNRPVKYEEIGPGVVRLTQEPDQPYGIQKEMELRLEQTGGRVMVLHRIKNVGTEPTDLAVWALTMMAPGGIEVIPLPPKKPHPGPPANARSPEDYAANQTMVLWPYFDFKDPRWTFGSKYITLRQDEKRGPTKIGLLHELGWVGYLNGSTLFVKRIDFQRGKTYPDRGVNFETFTNEEILEMESLGPLMKLAPGGVAELTERWELYKDVRPFSNEDEIDKAIMPRVKY